MKKLLISLLVFLYLGSPIIREILDNQLYIYTLDIGQGDSTLIKTPNNRLILVDTGPSNNILTELGEVLPYWARKIDYLILTHPDLDHISASIDLIERYEVNNIIWFRLEGSTPVYNWLKGYQLSNPELFLEVFNGQEINIDGIRLEFIFPEKDSSRVTNNKNNYSVSFILVYGDFKALFTGDAELETERRLLELGNIQKVTYFKGAHHCSKTSNTVELLELVRPDFIICSVGENNSFGHPSWEVVRRFKQMNIKYFRTDLQGRIEISTNGIGYNVKSEQ